MLVLIMFYPSQEHLQLKHDRQKIMRQTAEMDSGKYGDGVFIWFEKEGGSAGKDAARAIITAMSGFPVRADPVTGSKIVRAGPLQAQAEAGNVGHTVVFLRPLHVVYLVLERAGNDSR